MTLLSKRRCSVFVLRAARNEKFVALGNDRRKRAKNIAEYDEFKQKKKERYQWN